VLGAVDAESLSAFSDLRARVSRSAAYAVLVDTTSWLGRRVGPSSFLETGQAVAALRAAGWWVAAARQGETNATVWARVLEQASPHSLGDART